MAAGSSAAIDWAMFRHDAQHTGYSASNAPSTNLTQWNSTISQATYSSPAVANGVVYIGSGLPDHQMYAFGTYVPEGLTLGVMLLLSTIAVIASISFYRKRAKWQRWWKTDTI